jgi:hypothetical protein
MFLAEVALGREHHTYEDNWQVEKVDGCDSVVKLGREEPHPSRNFTYNKYEHGMDVTIPPAGFPSRLRFAKYCHFPCRIRPSQNTALSPVEFGPPLHVFNVCARG